MVEAGRGGVGWRARLAAGLLAAAMLAMAPAAAQPPVVHPLSEILAKGPDFTDLGPHSVTVRLETTIPVACSAVYGVTAAFGGLATDTDMAGGGHASHHPVLGGLQPDTVYQLRMQGVGADGTLYVSDLYSFRTPPETAATASPYGRNVALASAGAHVVAVSSNYGGGGLDGPYGGDNAIDGDPGTEWSSAGDGDKAWIEIDLGRPTRLDAVGLRTRTMGTSAQISRFRITTDTGQVLGPFDIPDASETYDFPVDATARTLRFEVLASSGGNTGVGEVEAFSR